MLEHTKRGFYSKRLARQEYKFKEQKKKIEEELNNIIPYKYNDMEEECNSGRGRTKKSDISSVHFPRKSMDKEVIKLEGLYEGEISSIIVKGGLTIGYEYYNEGVLIIGNIYVNRASIIRQVVLCYIVKGVLLLRDDLRGVSYKSHTIGMYNIYHYIKRGVINNHRTHHMDYPLFLFNKILG
ncbi:hypothetical protein CWI38_0005p0020 [Hamiltosporidium tvaerminnensis]|uniref:Uncharacterized protein n=1 Tax=Hamiltosporidium tvaerminnensis TaxID=1176355 RepID=A0A4Q9M5Y4_9MICR|nr:hypothetical protein CWI38_0005p0020 [Hamiltosporidium tvaerminnensis]